ncbi:hypothetical protein AMURIS_01075 [Acetatifactor muris]|uniref:PglD N-terminal domain-containing protein n=2 Tax=Acetatifactor muris TaxID=879566 RepID=A0A2K4ZD35_9FIRM|nr:hypothetical protein AMURIS_01075 [Acetatifactor muris]
MKNIVIVGASEFTREIAWLIDRINSVETYWNFLGYIDNCISDGKVIGDDAYLCNYSKELHVVIAIADTRKHFDWKGKYYMCGFYINNRNYNWRFLYH